MVCCTRVPLYPEQSAKFLEEFRYEVTTPIGDDFLRGPIMFEDLFHEKIAESFGIWDPCARDELSHLGESVSDYQDRIKSLSSDW